MWECRKCGGRVEVQLTQKMDITKDKKVSVDIDLKGFNKEKSRITCETHCSWTDNMEELEVIAKWGE